MRKKYSEMTKAEKRVAVAKDVIKQLQKKVYVAKKGQYVSSVKPKGVAIDADIKKHFNKIRHCKVCAMGACLLSITKFQNNLRFDQVGLSVRSLDCAAAKKLFSLFPPKQLLLIEHAFEGYSLTSDRVADHLFGINKSLNFTIQNKLDAFKNSHRDEKRIIAIMENIIKNKGTFKL